MGQTGDSADISFIPSTVLDMEEDFEELENSEMEVDSSVTISGASSPCFKIPDVHEQNFLVRKGKHRRPSTLLGALVNSSQHSSGESILKCRTTETCLTQVTIPQNSATVIIDEYIERNFQNRGEEIEEENNETDMTYYITDACSEVRPAITSLSHVGKLEDAVTSGEEAEVRRVLSEGGPHLLQVYTRHTRSTPLHLAAALAHSHLVTLLISAGCTIESFDADGNTPLHICCENADKQTASTLLSTSSNISDLTKVLNARNYTGSTCFLLAASSGNASLMTLLARAGCDVNIGDGLSGRTALHHAVAAGNILLVRFLLQTLKADVNRRDFGGNTALGLVEQHRRQDLALLLIRHGGEVRL